MRNASRESPISARTVIADPRVERTALLRYEALEDALALRGLIADARAPTKPAFVAAIAIICSSPCLKKQAALESKMCTAKSRDSHCFSNSTRSLSHVQQKDYLFMI